LTSQATPARATIHNSWERRANDRGLSGLLDPLLLLLLLWLLLLLLLLWLLLLLLLLLPLLLLGPPLNSSLTIKGRAIMVMKESRKGRRRAGAAHVHTRRALFRRLGALKAEGAVRVVATPPSSSPVVRNSPAVCCCVRVLERRRRE